MVSLVLKTIVVTVGWLVAADIAGALVVTVTDVLPLKFASAALAYAIWLVAGVFCGLFAYSTAGAWASPPKGDAPDWSSVRGARDIGTGVMVTGLIVVAALVALFYELFWRRGVAGDDYVPDSAPHSLVFFTSVAGAMVVGRFMLMSEPEPTI